MTAFRGPHGVLLEEIPPFRSASLSESTLLAGYSQQSLPVLRSELCACGGVITQHLHDDVAQVVEAHNETERHQVWSAQSRVL